MGLIPSEYSSGASRRQGGITKAGNGRARRALIEAAWAYRHPAKVSAHIQQRIDTLPRVLQDISWKAQVRLCKRFRRLVARGKHSNVAVTLAHGNEIVVRHGAKIIGTERDQRLRSAGCGNEFDTDGVRAVLLDNGTEIASAQVVGR